ncbi:hypothetical protein [Archangium lipolyticum]|uniref:hypothetical protein n=1 Tax=Archangium lipolyticum TaxID=2970465 RepID=UPI0038994D38
MRIQAGQVMMAQAHDEPPSGVREALGNGPQVRGMRPLGPEDELLRTLLPDEEI